MPSLDAQSDTELLEAWREGDLRAGDVLLGRHFDAVYGFFRRRVGGDVSDLVQRTFLACVESRDRFEGRSSVRAFVFGVARNVLLHHYAERTRDGAIDFTQTSIEDLCPSPSSLLRRKGDAELLHEALRRVAVDHQIALELCFWEGLKGHEIASVLGVPEGTVRSRLRRGLASLRAQLEALAGAQSRWADDEALEALARSARPARANDDLASE